MEQSATCPQCASTYPDIRGCVYSSDNSLSVRRCEHPWHQKLVHLSGEFDWTEFDIEVLKVFGIRAD